MFMVPQTFLDSFLKGLSDTEILFLHDSSYGSHRKTTQRTLYKPIFNILFIECMLNCT